MVSKKKFEKSTTKKNPFLIGKNRHGIGEKVVIFDWEWGRNSASRLESKMPWNAIRFYTF